MHQAEEAMRQKEILHSSIFLIRKTHFEFKGRVVRSFRQKFMVFEKVQYDFSVNEAIWIITCIVISVLRNTKVEQIQQILVTKENQIADLQC